MKAVIFVLCSVAALFLLQDYFGNKAYKIHFVVPDEFRGIIKVREVKDGVPVQRVNGVFRYRIPKDGIHFWNQSAGECA
jgi:hypothetical protein